MHRYLTVLFPFLLIITSATFSLCQTSNRWTLSEDEGIEWHVEKGDDHMDHIEMSGKLVSGIVHYGVRDGMFEQKIHLVFPMLRTIPNDTHASLLHEVSYAELEKPRINGEEIQEFPKRFYLKGMLVCESGTNQGVSVKHRIFPSRDQAVFIDQLSITNNTEEIINIELPEIDYSFTTASDKGVNGSYLIQVVSDKKGFFDLEKGRTLVHSLIYSGRKVTEENSFISSEYEYQKRKQLVESSFEDLVFESPDKKINRTFSFAKLRAVESIYQTKGGLMHGPGGGRYYAAIWANDQAEYANPFFPFLGNLEGNESAINSFRHFARFMNPDFNPIPSSIIAEGLDFWNGAGDRGDMAMIAYGATRFALALGNEKTARELWPLIEWCLEYSRRKINEDGVVSSDSDELEGRFPAGDANLNTSCLYYDALISAVLLAKELSIDPEKIERYLNQSDHLERAIENYFGAEISGFATYRYYKGNDVLRAWICTPLTVGIFDRSTETISALFSEKLWTSDGLASAAGSTTFWDRATLYALRGVFSAGEKEKGMNFLKYYSERRLLGDHVPYAVEAYPEGNQRHLSAESALYCRVITEGVFGIRPLGFKSFSLKPQLPADWDFMALRRIMAFDHIFDIEIERDMDLLKVRIIDIKNELELEKTILDGEKFEVNFY